MKFSLEWIGDRVAIAEAGGADGVRRLLDGAGLPVESSEGEGENAVFDVEITPNRPDAMSHRGLAREVAAMAGVPYRDSVGGPGGGGRVDMIRDWIRSDSKLEVSTGSSGPRSFR